jgi:hypothetical protein
VPGSVTGEGGEREAFARPSRRSAHGNDTQDLPGQAQPVPGGHRKDHRRARGRARALGAALGQRRVNASLGLPKNAATGRGYSAISILILWGAVAERGFTGQRWLTFREALGLGGHVRKGEKGTTVVYADRFIPNGERTCAEEAGEEPDSIPFLKRFTVFNTDQCEDLPAEASAAAPPPPPRKRDPPRGRRR